MEKVKTCKKCNITYQLNDTNFFKRKGSKDGFRNECKKCNKEKNRKYYRDNKEKVLSKNKEYRENHKEEIAVKKAEYTKNSKDKITKYLASNREERRIKSKEHWEEKREYYLAKAKEWKSKNKERVKQYKIQNKERDRQKALEYYRTEEGRLKRISYTNRYRARKKELLNDFTVKQWAECIEHFNHSCAYCGEYQEVLEQEHFVPVSKGGHFTKNNILPACRTCNASKNGRDYIEWYTARDFFSKERHLIILKYLGKGLDDDNSAL